MINVPYEDMPREIEALLGEIEQLEQENQKLKFQLEYEKENLMFSKDYAKSLEEKRDLYKSVLDEIREYIENEGVHTDCSGEPIYYLDEEQEKELLEILDKVKE